MVRSVLLLKVMISQILTVNFASQNIGLVVGTISKFGAQNDDNTKVIPHGFFLCC